jgi:hypothetical protein
VTSADSAGLRWYKSSSSGSEGCVEVAFVEASQVFMRDSKVPDGPVLQFDPMAWEAFVAGVQAGEFDLPS